MCSISQVQIHNLRNLKSRKFILHKKLNIFFGNNGSGKTSILEAIYLLSTGRSFRCRENLPLIRNGEQLLAVFARTFNSQSISIQKMLHAPMQIRINTQPCYNTSALAHILPCQIFYQDIFQIIESGPAVRRSLLDWGVFYFKTDYHLLCKQYNRALKQRNILLKQNATIRQLSPWNKLLTELAIEIDAARQAYCAQLVPEFIKILQQLTDMPCSLQYYKGWDKAASGKSLTEILEANYTQDLVRQYTRYGPHQADLLLFIGKYRPKHYLSRGQQKIILFALKLAQSHLLSQPCIYLCDDFFSELDQAHADRVLQTIMDINGQFILTSVLEKNLSPFFEGNYFYLDKDESLTS